MYETMDRILVKTGKSDLSCATAVILIHTNRGEE